MISLKEKEKIDPAIETTCRNIYGSIPIPPKHLHLEFVSEIRPTTRLVKKNFRLIFEFENTTEMLPLSVLTRNDGEAHPVIIYADQAEQMDAFFFMCEPISRGYTVVKPDFSNLIHKGGKINTDFLRSLRINRKRNDCPGTIALVSWMLMRVIECVCSNALGKANGIILFGNSVFAKSALLTAGYDSRVSCVMATNSLDTSDMFGCDDRFKQLSHLFCPTCEKAFTKVPQLDDQILLLKFCLDRNMVIGISDLLPFSIASETTRIRELLSCGKNEDSILFRRFTESIYPDHEDWVAILNFFEGLSKA